jgi:nitrous oxidase accessory protein NosD
LEVIFTNFNSNFGYYFLRPLGKMLRESEARSSVLVSSDKQDDDSGDEEYGYEPRKRGPTPIYATNLPAKVQTIVTNLPSCGIRPVSNLPKSTSFVQVQAGAECISRAIESAPEGATIRIPAGKYTECLSIKKSISLVAEGKVSIISDGTGEALLINAHGVCFEGLSIKQTSSHNRAAVCLMSGSASFVNCKIRSAAIASCLVKGEAHLTLSQCLLYGATSPALSLVAASQALIDRCIFSDCKIAAVTLKSTAVASISQCVFRNNAKGGISASDRSAAFIDSSRFSDCGVDFASEGTTNVIVGCVIERSTNPSVIIGGSATAYIWENTISGGCVDSRDRSVLQMGNNKLMSAGVVAWGSAKVVSQRDQFLGKIDCAIAVSQSAALTLNGSVIKDISGTGIIGYGESTVFAESVKIVNPGHYGIMGHSGVTIACKATEIISAADYGILINAATKVTLESTLIRDSKKSGIEIYQTKEYLFSDSQFDGNRKCGIVIIGSNGELKSCESRGNSFSGMHLHQSVCEMIGCVFEKNAKGGLVLSQGSRVNGQTSTFKGNMWAGLSVDRTSGAEFWQSGFADNQTGLNCCGDVSLKSCRFTGNRVFGAQVTGKAILEAVGWEREVLGLSVSNEGSATIKKCFFLGNSVHVEVGGGCSLTANECEFNSSSGDCGVHVVEGKASFEKCAFGGNRNVAIIVEGEVTINESKVVASGTLGVVFDGKASGSIRKCVLEDNGECGCQCIRGNPLIVENEIRGHSKFGLFLCSESAPIVEENKFEGNGLANVWRE